jgi:hypothetical protein
MARGLNGETVFDAENVHVGYVDGEGYGYRGRCPVTVDVRMERLDRRTYETTDHRQVSKPVDFAMTAAVWQPNGADMIASGDAAEILAALTEFAPGWDAAKVAALAGLAPLHLNDMNAGCDHQAPVMEDDGYGGQRVSLDLTPPCRTPAAMRLHPGEPETDESPARPGGYRYGSAWLLRDLPAGTLKRVRDLFRGARAFDPGATISGDGITAVATTRESPPAWATGDRGSHGQWWDVTLTNAAGASMTVPFFMGSGHTEIIRGARLPTPPTARDVLRCLADDAAGYDNARDFADWAGEYGLETTREARRMYDLTGGQTAELRAFLGDRYGAYLRGEA